MLTFSLAHLATFGGGSRARSSWRREGQSIWPSSQSSPDLSRLCLKALEDLRDNILARHWPATKTPTTSQFNCFYL